MGGYKIKIYMLSRPMIDLDTLERFLNDENLDWRRTSGAQSAEELVEFAGRICYLSFGPSQSPRNNAEYISNLISQGHESVLEHASWSFLLCGISRSFSHQLVRHRAGFSFSQLSQQYHGEEAAKFVIPEFVRQLPEAENIWRQSMQSAKEAYLQIMELVEEGGEGVATTKRRKEKLRAARSAARSVLPNATETKIVITANARALRHFLKLRGSIEGDEEMRRVSALILEEFQNEAPSLFSDFSLDSLEDGSPIVRHSG